MSIKIDELILQIKTKIAEIKSSNKELKHKNDLLVEENKLVKEQLLLAKNQVLHEELKNKELNETIVQMKTNVEMINSKQKEHENDIEELVGEIDACIRLLKK